MPTRVGRISPWLLTLVVVGACRKEPSGPAGPTMPPPRDQPFVMDVPVPDKFKLDREKSDHSYREGRRKVKHFYLGNEEPLPVRNFYVQHMPGQGWKLVNEVLKNGVYTLTFRKAEERCEIRIEKIPAGLFSPGTRIRAMIGAPGLESGE